MTIKFDYKLTDIRNIITSKIDQFKLYLSISKWYVILYILNKVNNAIRGTCKISLYI